MEDRMTRAIQHACRALRQRHALEEGAHAPALLALSQSLSCQGKGLQEKVDSLQQELMQCYRAQTQLSEQLVQEVTSSKVLRSQQSESNRLIGELQAELLAIRERLIQLEVEVERKSSALEIAIQENIVLHQQHDELEVNLKKAEAENKLLVDRWMLQKMQDAERLNEANAMYEDMMERLKASRLEDLAKQQVDGVVRLSESGAEDYVQSRNPTSIIHTIQAHAGGCTALQFEHNSQIAVSGGHDHLVKIWDTNSVMTINTLYGCLGSVFDLVLSSDNKLILAASSDHKLYLWDIKSGRIRHTLTGHTDKVSAVDISKLSNRRAVSAAYDRTIKVWDLHTGYGVNTIVCYSNCNSLCLTTDAAMICSGHVDGNLRFWDLQTGKLANEVAAHAQGITSVSLSRSGHRILTSGRDNIHHMFDVRTLESCNTFRAQGHRLATNWSRSCISPNEDYVAAGSADGTVLVWSKETSNLESTLKGHGTSPVLTCAWSDVGKPLVTADKNGSVCFWE
eukprot:c15631_g1_i1 orf=223-1749(-)